MTTFPTGHRATSKLFLVLDRSQDGSSADFRPAKCAMKSTFPILSPVSSRHPFPKQSSVRSGTCLGLGLGFLELFPHKNGPTCSQVDLRVARDSPTSSPSPRSAGESRSPTIIQGVGWSSGRYRVNCVPKNTCAASTQCRRSCKNAGPPKIR